MSCVPSALPSPPCIAALAAALLLPCAGAQDVLPLASAAPSGAVLSPAPGLRIQYEPLGAGSGPPAGRLDGALDTGRGTLRGSLRIDPAAQAPLQRLDANWASQLPGPWQTLVVGETHGSGGGWSQPVALTGLRFGRPLAWRAPPPDTDNGVHLPGFAPSQPWPPGGLALPPALRLRDAAGAAMQDSRALLAPGALAGGPPVQGPQTLQPGATDYEVELGRLREQPGGFAAAGWRVGLLQGLTAEARAEWMAERVAHGVELVQSAGAGTLQASVAQAAGGQGSGLRWAMGWVQGGEDGHWRLGWDGSERGFTNTGGGMEPRAALRAATGWKLGRSARADLSYTRSLAWDAALPDATLKLATRWPLARRLDLSLGVSLQDGSQPGWGAAMSLSVPLGD
ncbi:hypothetical protein PE066_02860 [Ramlibacter tataouinensis]|uniref:hypothetical protein n=1 Tax=Ramlibacter tataouinensis TaxID=94132 RepID=UPI0022F3C586|nr:hypothetical protein [Ramlibacter tataouinensis]WBY02495.1 hypothetical protein PE066_02860 [Ramlibacter tataouinensis]